MWTRLKQNLHIAFWNTDLVHSRFTLAIAEFMWALMLFWVGDSFARPTYSHMAAIMSEEWWATLFFVSGCFQVYIIVARCFDAYWAWLFAAFNFLLWSYTVWSMLASVYPPPAAIGGEIALTLSAFWIWFRPLIGERIHK